jgi:hypothetical protein
MNNCNLLLLLLIIILIIILVNKNYLLEKFIVTTQANFNSSVADINNSINLLKSTVNGLGLTISDFSNKTPNSTDLTGTEKRNLEYIFNLIPMTPQTDNSFTFTNALIFDEVENKYLDLYNSINGIVNPAPPGNVSKINALSEPLPTT